MSAGMLMMASVELTTTVRPLSTDLPAEQGTTENVSFAKSLSERFGEDASQPGKSSVEEPTIAFPGLGVGTTAKKLDEAPKALDGAKGKTVAGQEISGQGSRKGADANNILETQSPAVTVPQEKIAAAGPESKDVKPTATEDLPADDGSPDSSAPKIGSVTGLTDEAPGASLNISEKDRPFVLRVDSPVAQKETESSGATKEIISAKKPVKAQENNKATSKAAQQAVGAEGNAFTKGAAAIANQDVVPVSQGAVTNAVPAQKDFAKATSDGPINAIATIASGSTEVSPTSVRGPIEKERTKAGSLDTETTVNSAPAQPEVPKSDVGLEKTVATALSTDSASDGKVPSAPSSATAAVHSISTSAATPGALSTVVVSGSAQGESTVTKLPGGEAGAHTTGLPAASREQDRPGMSPAAMDEVPRMLTATPTALEVGIQNGTHGWLRVRAEMADGGVVNASVSAASSTGQEMLHRELPALTAYLQQEKVAVNAIVVHTTPAVAAEGRSSLGTDGGGGQAQQRGNEGGDQQQSVRKQTLNDTDGTMTYPGLQGVDEDGSSSLATYESGGSWLSVRA